MKYKVGDKVRVRINLVPSKMYGSLTFLEGNMSKCAGQICTIMKVHGDEKYYVSENPFIWSEEMLEPADNIVRMADGTIIGDFSTGGFCDGFRGGKIPTPDELIKKEFNVKWIEEEKKMPTKFTFYFNVDEGTRVDKSCNGTIPTVTTTVVLDKFGDSNRKNCYSLNGKATCDKADYNMRQGVLEALANAVFDGNFEKAYNKAVKTNEFCERKDRTCHYCGQLFDTIAEKEAHEAWHVEHKKARRERYLLRKRAKEIAFEEQAQKMAKEIIVKDNKK